MLGCDCKSGLLLSVIHVVSGGEYKSYKFLSNFVSEEKRLCYFVFSRFIYNLLRIVNNAVSMCNR